MSPSVSKTFLHGAPLGATLFLFAACASDGDTSTLAGSGGALQASGGSDTNIGAGTGAVAGTGAAVGTGSGGSGEDAAANDAARCAEAGLTWRTARKTTYTSYPDPESEECIVYNGCKWAGWFASCTAQQPEEWVSQTNIAAIFLAQEDYQNYAHHEVCIRNGDKVMIVNIIDTCGDSDCDGCCTRNQGTADALIDLESATNARWALPDGQIEWASLGANPSPVCD